MASTNSVQWLLKEEASYGVNPGGVFQAIELVNDTLNQEQQTTNDGRIVSDRLPRPSVLTDSEGKGSIGGPLAASVWDTPLEGVMGAAWPGSEVAITDTGISFVAATKKISRASGSWIADGIKVGQWIKVSGSADNDGWGVVIAATALDLTVSVLAVVDETAGASVTISGTPLVHGTILKSYALQRGLTDLTPAEYHQFLGLVFNAFKLSGQIGAVMQASFDLVAGNETASDTSLASSVTAAPDTEAFNTLGTVKATHEGGNPDIDLSSLDLTLTAGARSKKRWGQVAPFGVALGGITLVGNASLYYADKTLLNKGLQRTTTSVGVFWEDAAGNGFGFNIPALKLSVKTDVSGGDKDIMAACTLTADKDPASGEIIVFSRYLAS